LRINSGTSTLSILKANFKSNVVGCALVFNFVETTASDSGLTHDCDAGSNSFDPDNPFECADVTFSRDELRDTTAAKPPFKFKLTVGSGGVKIV
jgi:hypothetical protein